MDFGFIITYLNRMKQEIVTTINSIDPGSGGGGGGNPSGGQVDIATTNYKTALMQQWITLTIGSGSAQLLNLLNAELETFNLSASTFLYGGYSTLPVSAAADNYWQLDSASGARLPGVITPANLKLSARFQGANGSNYLGAEAPLYTGRLASQWVIGGGTGLPTLTGLYPYSQFVGGTVASNAGVAANAFDGDVATSCAVGTQPCFVSYDLGAGNDKVLKYFYFRATNTNNGIWKIEGSNDNSNWTQLATNQATSSDILITTTNTTSYRYYRVSSVSVVSGVVIEFEGFLASFVPAVTYDTSTFAIGTSSGNFNGGIYLPVSSINTAETNVGPLDFQFRGFVNFSAISGTQTIFTLNNTLEIQGTTSGLRVRYSTNGSSFTNIDSSAITWSPNTWYFLSVRRTGNTLYFFVNGTAYGTADLTGVSLYSNNTSPHGKVGCDTNTLNWFKGHLQELEFFVRTLEVDTAPASPRNTAFLPPVNLASKANYIPTSAEKLDALFFLDETTWASFGVPIFGTDLTLQVSLNNGTTWNTVSMSKTSALSTLTNIYTGTLDLTGITNTNQLVYKIINNSGKVLKWDGLIMYWN